jgi:predicted RND superfamily exporter protein
MIDKIFEAIAGTINRRPALVACLLVAVFCIALYGMSFISMQTGTEVYLDKYSEKGILNTRYTDSFQSDSLILIIETNDPLNPDVLTYIDTLEASVRQQQNIKSVNGIVDLLKAANGGKLPQSKAEIYTIVAKIPPEVQKTAVPSNVMTLVQIQLDEGLSEKVRNGALANIQKVVSTSDPTPGTKVTVTGSPAFSKEMSSSLGKDMGMLIGGAMILIIIVMGILFGYVRYRFMPVALVGVGLITHGTCRHSAEHGSGGSISGAYRSWDRLCHPVPCPF